MNGNANIWEDTSLTYPDFKKDLEASVAPEKSLGATASGKL